MLFPYQKTESQQQPELPTNIPRDPQRFYQDFGLLTHPKTGQPSPKLMPYQYDVWQAGKYHRYRLAIKSQKIGLSTSVLMEDFWHAITDCKGYEILVIAQTVPHAREHLYTLREMLLNSKKYACYLQSTPTDLLKQDEVTKVTMLYIKNPDNPLRPTRIIGLGANEASVWSWKRVKHIHCSDLAVVNQKDYSGLISAAMTRLANTDGSIIIETPPRGPQGKVYEIYMQSRLAKADSPEGQFKLFTIPAREAVGAGLISQEFLDGERIRLGAQYAQYYEAEFITGTGTCFKLEDVEATQNIPYDPDPESLPYGLGTTMGVDPGFGSSNFGVCITAFVDGKARVLLADEYERPSDGEMIPILWDHIQHFRVNKVYVDNSRPSIIKSLKLEWGERADYENIPREKYEYSMRVVPVAFGGNQGQEHRAMLSWAKTMIEKRWVAIDKGFTKLLDSLRTATENEGRLDKELTAYDDILDSFRLSIRRYKEEVRE
jgi:hypothetical protein